MMQWIGFKFYNGFFIQIGKIMRADTKPVVLFRDEVRKLLPSLEVRGALEAMFRDLGNGKATQPAQTLAPFPGQSGDFISYLGVLAGSKVFGAKLSPYIAGEGNRPIVTAWTLLMSMETGQPLVLCDASLLTTERTAATTALAIDRLAPATASRLALIGAGPVGLAHLRHALGVRPWTSVWVYAPGLSQNVATRGQIAEICAEAQISNSSEECAEDADVVMLCTSSAAPVIDITRLRRPALITSISTNAPNAHEIDPALLPSLDVYCDYKNTTPDSAGDMLIAAELHGWHRTDIAGDLADLVNGSCALPDYGRHAYFRSIGLGLEDIAMADALYRRQMAMR